MQKITPCIWFNMDAEEAAKCYVSTFASTSAHPSRLGHIARYGKEGAKASGLSEGSVLTVTFQLYGRDFMALNGGPAFSISPAISFFVQCTSIEEIDALWEKLTVGGKVLMEFGAYPFGEKFGWLEDKFGVSWQLYLGSQPRSIVPFLLFVGKEKSIAEEAMNFYVSLFRHSGVTTLTRYGPGEGEPVGSVKRGSFSLDGEEFMAIDSSMEHAFTFTPGVSFVVSCESQEEIDGFWEKLCKGGKEGQCGWLVDKFGVSWQIVPSALGEMIRDTDDGRSERVMAALMRMKKLDESILKDAYEHG